ncbi:AIM24 family protein [Aliamphritea spongicola]
MQCHEVDYEIVGSSMPLLEVELDPGETVIAEAGMMNYMEDGISYETRMGDGSDPDQGLMSKLFSAGKRMLTGESLFMTHFSNEGRVSRGWRLLPLIRETLCRLIWLKLVSGFTARKMHSCVPHWVPGYRLPSLKSWVQAFWR